MKATEKLLTQAYKKDGVEGLNKIGAELAKFLHNEGEASTVTEANKMAKDIMRKHLQKLLNN